MSTMRHHARHDKRPDHRSEPSPGVWHAVQTVLEKPGAVWRLVLVLLVLLAAPVGVVALVAIYLGPVGVGALVPLIGCCAYGAKRCSAGRSG